MKEYKFVITKFITKVGYPGYVLFNNKGIYCGYVEIPELQSPLSGTPIYSVNFEDIELWTPTHIKIQQSLNNLDVHWGITFCSRHSVIDNKYLIGFDCHHCQDIPDIELAKKLFGNDADTDNIYIPADATLKDFTFVKEQVEHLADQLLPINKLLEELQC